MNDRPPHAELSLAASTAKSENRTRFAIFLITARVYEAPFVPKCCIYAIFINDERHLYKVRATFIKYARHL